MRWMRMCWRSLPLSVLAVLAGSGAVMAQEPAAIAAPGETVVATLHAEGAQVYECKAGNDGKLAWAFREPIATLVLDGKTVGRHYAGPNWEHADGSAVVGKAVGNAPGKSAERHPLAQARSDGASRQRRALGRHHGAADQYRRRRPRRCLRQGRCAPQRALCRGLRFPAQGTVIRHRRASASGSPLSAR